MQRRSFLTNAGIAGVLASGVAPSLVHAQQNIRWRLASSFPRSLDTLFGGAEVFAKNVSLATGGKFTISVHPGGELVPAMAVFDAVQQGTVECAHTAPSYFFGKDEAFSLDCQIPFGMNSRQQTAWMYEGNGQKLIRDLYAKYNIINFACGNSGTQMAGWYRKELKSIADINGLKMRIGGFGGMVLTRLGAVPQNIPGGEVYQALEKGTIDAAEWVGPYDDLKLGFYKVAPHYYYPAWWEGGTQFSVYIGSNAFNGLSAEYKEIVRQAASDAHVTVQARYDARNPMALRELVSKGAKLARMPKEIMDAALKATRELYAELDAKNPNWKRIHGDYAAFQAKQNEWFRVAEGSYDGYMSIQTLQP